MTGGLLLRTVCVIVICVTICVARLGPFITYSSFLQRETNRKVQRELNNNSEGVFLGSP